MKTPKLFAVVLAGGSGTRFWPLSRNARPKQLLPLFGEQTLLEATLDRLDGLVPPENILILTNPLQFEAVREVCADRLPEGNIVAEPERRDTGPAIALALGWVAARDPEAVMMVLPSDQLIGDIGRFREVLQAAAAAATSEAAIVTVGIRPAWPCPGYGYIEMGNRLALDGIDQPLQPSEVVCFREKPDRETAEAYLASGRFCWNAGMFIWSVAAVLGEMEQHAPALAAFARTLSRSPDFPAGYAADFAALPKLSIDFALMEKASKVLTIEATFGWDDVGSWISAAGYFPDDGAGNRSNQPAVTLGSTGNIVFNDRPGSTVVLLGIEDLIVVQTDDALLVARKSEADRIKQVVDRLPEGLR